MAEHPKEVLEITSSADSLMLNLGNITDARMDAMLISAKKANKKGIPIVLDAVGIACSSLRKEYINDLLNKARMTVIKGNYSEICALYNNQYSSVGVDADISLSPEKVKEAAVNLALKYHAVILATGKTDIITNGENTICVNNGCEELASVTGTGCMLGSLCSAFIVFLNPMEASVSACCYLGICGELSKTKKGSGSFMVNLLDKISTLSREEIQKHLNMEDK